MTRQKRGKRHDGLDEPQAPEQVSDPLEETEAAASEEGGAHPADATGPEAEVGERPARPHDERSTEPEDRSERTSSIKELRKAESRTDDPDDDTGADEAEQLELAHDEGRDQTSRKHLRTVLESLIFVADKPVSAKQLGRVAKTTSREVRSLVAELIEEYQGRGIELAELATGYQFRTSPVSAPFVRDFVSQKPVRLTRAQLETLAIVAYRQPVTRPEVDDIRGVDSGSAIKVLLERGLLKMLGRKDEPGRPMMYGTPPYFLEFFGLKSLSELPTLQEFSELTEESRDLFRRRAGETLEEYEREAQERQAEGPEQEGEGAEGGQTADVHEEGAEPAAEATEEEEGSETATGEEEEQGSSDSDDDEDEEDDDDDDDDTR